MKTLTIKTVLGLALCFIVTAGIAGNDYLEFETDRFRFTTSAGKTLGVVIVKYCDTCASERLLVTGNTRINHHALGTIRAYQLGRYQDHPAYLKADRASRELERVEIFAREE